MWDKEGVQVENQHVRVFALCVSTTTDDNQGEVVARLVQPVCILLPP